MPSVTKEDFYKVIEQYPVIKGRIPYDTSICRYWFPNTNRYNCFLIREIQTDAGAYGFLLADGIRMWDETKIDYWYSRRYTISPSGLKRFTEHLAELYTQYQDALKQLKKNIAIKKLRELDEEFKG